ncbi:MAG: NAD(P)H-dependent oxidoreductase [Ignavibacterium sp.]|nr:MAG: NAD(P)H-dependent oxidoreductase [Ignavibacterium sp.]
MAKVLILFAHPALEKSRINKRLISAAENVDNVTINDLYEAYPDFDIDIKREQKLLTDHDLIILHYPFYWYSTPAILKQWEDLVLEHGWAYGSKGKALVGRKVILVITTGGSAMAYQKESFNKHTIHEFLVPLEQSFKLCGMKYLPPFLVQGTHKLENQEIEIYTEQYSRLLKNLAEDKYDYNEMMKHTIANELL